MYMIFTSETEILEFKKTTAEMKEAVVSVCAMLNKHGYGDLYFGIRNDGTVVGQTVNEKTLSDISTAIGNHIRPQIYPEINQELIENKNCVHVKFSGENKPYYVYGQARIRVADRDILMSPEQLEEFILEKNYSKHIWEDISSDYKIENIDEGILKKYIKRARGMKRITFEYTCAKNVLEKLGLIRERYLLNAAKVLFCDSDMVEIQMAIFATDERLTFNDIQRHHGNIFDMVEIAELYIKNNIHWKVDFDGSLERKETPEIPIAALREALINSFCHKDYSLKESNEIAIYNNRIEIYNPGRFPTGKTPEDYIERDERPVRRNPLIARTLYYSKDVESFGTGLKRITLECLRANVKVVFKQIKTGFVVVFYRGAYDNSSDIAKADTASNKIGVPSQSGKSEWQVEGGKSKGQVKGDKSKGQVEGASRGGKSEWQVEVASRSGKSKWQVIGASNTEMKFKILSICSDTPASSMQIARKLGYETHNSYLRKCILKLKNDGLLEFTIPEKPASRLQQYKITEQGHRLLSNA